MPNITLPCDPQSEQLRWWRDLAKGDASFSQLAAYARTHPRLPLLALDTTGSCDLTCPGMCYYNPNIALGRTPPSYDLIAATVDEAATTLSLQTLVFAGKEPLLDAKRLFALCDRFGPRDLRSYQVGIATNGRLIARHWDSLKDASERAALDFLDISLDSFIPEQHDTIRGRRGTFDCAWGALERCGDAFPNVRVGVGSVLRRDNSAGLLALYRHASAICKHFYVVPMVPPIFSQSEAPAWTEISGFIHALKRLLVEDLGDAGIDVMMSLLGVYLYDAVGDGAFAWHDVREDSKGWLYVSETLGRNRLIFHLLPLAETAWRIARINYAGDYLTNTHFLQADDPVAVRVGNIVERPIGELYRAAISDGSLWADVLRSRDAHECRHMPCWTSCFGGYSVAEQQQINGLHLTAQPNLCKKPLTGQPGSPNLLKGTKSVFDRAT